MNAWVGTGVVGGLTGLLGLGLRLFLFYFLFWLLEGLVIYDQLTDTTAALQDRLVF